MKAILYFIFLCTLAFPSLALSKGPFKENGKFTITGNIKNYIPGDNNGFITFRTYDVMGYNKDTSVQINAKGSFNCILNQSFEGDIGLIYKGDYITLYAIPFEKMIIEINDNQWSKKTQKTKAMTFQGEAALFSKWIIDFKYEFSKTPFNSEPDLGNNNISAKEFAVERIRRMLEELEFLAYYVKHTKIKNIKFQTWCRNDIIYRSGSEIVNFGFYGEINRSNTHIQLINLLADIPISNEGALNNSVYYNFLNSLQGGFQIIVNVNPVYKDSTRQMGNSGVPVVMQQINRYATGIAKELLYYDLTFYRSKDKGSFYSLFSNKIKNSYLRKLFENGQNKANVFTSYNFLERIKKYPGSEILIEKLGLISSRSERFIFMDFWGSWCGPCMKEMPLYPELIAKFSEKPIDFLFLAVDTQEDKIQEVKNKYGIKGRFISLTGNETKMLENTLQFSSYPRHFIVDSSGMVLSNSISGLGSGDELNPRISVQIEKTISNK